MTAPPVVHRLFGRLFRVLDSEGAAFFQAIVYIFTAAAGAYCAFIAESMPTVLSDSLPAEFGAVWLWLCMGTTICLIGKYLSSQPHSTRYWVYTTGLALQFAGDISALGAFLGYVLSTLQEQTWGRAIVAAWVFASLSVCAFFLCWRDIRRWVQAERAVRRL